MHLFYLDAYFRLASRGDKDALKTLYTLFQESALIEMHSAKKNFSNFAEIPEDFCILVDDLFFSILNDYDPDRGSFRWYVSYVLEKKISLKVKQSVTSTQRHIKIIREEPEIVFGLEDTPDPSILDLSSDVAIDNFKCKIASPLKHQTKPERIQQKILLLKYAGYSLKEICRELNISRSTLEHQLKIIKRDDVIVNLKLEMK